jgi:hypothetical protein
VRCGGPDFEPDDLDICVCGLVSSPSLQCPWRFCISILPRWIYDGIGTGTSVLFPLIFEFVAGAGVYLEVGLDRRDVMTALASK